MKNYCDTPPLQRINRPDPVAYVGLNIHNHMIAAGGCGGETQSFV